MKSSNEIDTIIQNVDCLVFLATLKDNSVDLVLTDPPYQISRKTGFKSVKKGVERLKISMDFGKWDNQSEKIHHKMMKDVCKEVYRVLRDGGTVIMFYDLWKITELSNMLKDAGFKMLRFVEHLKTNPVPINSKCFYLSNAREIAIACVKGGKPTFNAEYHNGIFTLPIHRDEGKRIHPTQKSIALMKAFIKIHSKENDFVIDPFAGSGTTMVSAMLLNRVTAGCEIDKKYYKVAVQRIKKFLLNTKPSKNSNFWE